MWITEQKVCSAKITAYRSWQVNLVTKQNIQKEGVLMGQTVEAHAGGLKVGRSRSIATPFLSPSSA